MRTKAALRIGGPRVNPNEIERRTSTKPTKAHAAGEKKFFGGRECGTWDEGNWRLESPLSESASLEDHLKWLIDSAKPVREIIRETLADNGYASAFVGLFEVSGNSGATVSSETMRELGSLGLKLELDLYSE